MHKRSRVPYRAGKASFSRSARASGAHPKNAMSGGPLMRGGIRL